MRKARDREEWREEAHRVFKGRHDMNGI